MSFVTREDILRTFEGLISHLFNKVSGMDIGSMPLMPYSEAMRKYGNDKPDTRFGMTFVELKNRSEEHTSELQSLMRNSYAVFCLKKKNSNNQKAANKTKYEKQTT